MALFVIGDTHLSLGSDKPMDVFGGGWEGYVDKLREGFHTEEAARISGQIKELSEQVRELSAAANLESYIRYFYLRRNYYEPTKFI